MSFQSADCFYSLCDRCNTKGCGCLCHLSTKERTIKIEYKDPIIKGSKLQTKLSLSKRRKRLLEVLDPNFNLFDTNETN